MVSKYTRATLLTTASSLHGQLNSDLCLVDVRPAEDFARGHIPGAVHWDLFGLSLVDTREAPLKAFMHMIHHVLELRGVNENKTIVFYEENSGMRAARAVWFLEYFGHPNARMLDGGLQAWKAAGYRITTEAIAPQPSTFTTHERGEVLATADDVLQSLKHNEIAIVDTRSRGEYLGTHVRA